MCIEDTETHRKALLRSPRRRPHPDDQESERLVAQWHLAERALREDRVVDPLLLVEVAELVENVRVEILR